MNGRDAADILTQAICSTDGLAALTTAPTDEQAEALRSVNQDDIAPGQVCDEMEVPQGSTWGAIAREIAVDVTSSLPD